MLSLLLLYPMMSLLWTVVEGSRSLGNMSRRGLVPRRKLLKSKIGASSPSSPSMGFPQRHPLPVMWGARQARPLTMYKGKDPENNYALESWEMPEFGLTAVCGLRPNARGKWYQLNERMNFESDQTNYQESFSLNAIQVLSLRSDLTKMVQVLHQNRFQAPSVIKKKISRIVEAAKEAIRHEHELLPPKHTLLPHDPFVKQVKLAHRILECVSLASIMSLAEVVSLASVGMTQDNAKTRPAFSLTIIPDKFEITIRTHSVKFIYVGSQGQDGTFETLVQGLGREVLLMRPGDTFAISYDPTKRYYIDPAHLRASMLSGGLGTNFMTSSDANNPTELSKKIVHSYMKNSELPLILLFYRNQ